MQEEDQETSAPSSGSSNSPRGDNANNHEHNQFTFVFEKNQAGTRNHAMRAHWNQRRKHKQEVHKPSTRKRLPHIAPKNDAIVHRGSQDSALTRETIAPQQTDASLDGTEEGESATDSITGIPSQLVTGLNYALGCTRLDPFDAFPITLTGQHHKLMHHWLSTHATMMFEDMPTSSFNPMRDVWFPLDLSNAASFNAIMAHSAAHLAFLYGGPNPTRGTTSPQALQFKYDAVRILNQWLADPEKYLCNDTIAAVVRLLTFERYWGTEEEWVIHRTGLQRMIEARGGLHQLHSDWRLELVVGLISLMSKPSWFESANDLSEISEHTAHHNTLGISIDIRKVRSLWLLSFIQDMRNLMQMSSQLYREGLCVFPSLYEAILLIRASFGSEGQARKTRYSASDYDRLTCLFSISIMVQESASLAGATVDTPLFFLDMTLGASQPSWAHSVSSLRSFLHTYFINTYANGAAKIDYVIQMTDIIGHLSLEAHRGVEACLLNMFCRPQEKSLTFLVDDLRTPDLLLSSMHGI